MNGMYWVTRGGFVVQQHGSISGLGRASRIFAYNVPSGGFRGRLRLDRLRPATPHEIKRAKERS